MADLERAIWKIEVQHLAWEIVRDFPLEEEEEEANHARTNREAYNDNSSG